MMKTDTKAQFSVLLPTYAGDDSTELDSALDSCFDQTMTPEEVLVIEDGPLTDALASTLAEWERRHPDVIRRYAIPENTGLGNALRVGVQNCKNPLVARFDADDLNVPTRFETQYTYLDSHPGIDVLGGYIAEFDEDPKTPVTVREVPIDHEDIRRMARFRSPMNHGTVMFRRDAVLRAGNYRAVTRMEDYDLWVRLLCDGATFANVPEVLVKVRGGEDMATRRGGLEYAQAEVRRQIEFYRHGFTNLPTLLFNLVARTSIRFLPNRLRWYLYARFARKGADSE